MKTDYKKILVLPICLLFGASALSACAAASTSQEDETELGASTQEETNTEEPAALYFIDYAEEDEDIITLTLKVYLLEGTFAPDFDAERIVFGKDLSNAYDIKVSEMDENQSEAEICLSLSKADLDLENSDLHASMILKAGAVKDEDGQNMQDLLLEQDLIYASSDTKAAAPVTAQYLPDSKTLVYRFSGSDLAVSTMDLYDNVMSGYLHSGNMHQLIRYIVLDFTNAKENTRDTSYILEAFTLTLRQQYNMEAIVLNGANTGTYTYRYLKSRKSKYGDDRIQYLAGDTFSLDFSSNSLYEDIQNLVNAGVLKSDE